MEYGDTNRLRRQDYYVTHPDSSVEGPIATVSRKAITAALSGTIPLAGHLLEPFVDSAVKYLLKQGKQVTTKAVRKVITQYMAGKAKPQVQKGKALKTSKSAGTVHYASGGSSVAVKQAPVAKGVSIKKQSKPKTKPVRNGVLISHSEMLSSVVTSATTLTYQCNSLIANPGRSAMFPWLSTIAMNYDKYRFRKLAVTFVTNQSTATSGKVGVGFDYDSTDPKPGDRIEFFALTHHCEGPVWDSLTLSIPCDNVQRFTNTHTTVDSKLIDLGQVLVMTDQVVSTAQNIGDIIVDYEVELIAAQQALFTTQICTATNLAAVPNQQYFSTNLMFGPSLFTFTGNTTASLTVGVNQGYYIMYSLLQDTGATLTVTTSGASSGLTVNSTGRTSTNQYTYLITAVKCEVPTGTFLLNSGSNFVSDENVVVIVSRVSPAVYNALVGSSLN